MKNVALWTLFAISAAAFLSTQIGVGRYLARRRFAEPAAAAVEMRAAERDRTEADWPDRDEPIPADDAPSAPPPVPTVVLPPAPSAAAAQFDSEAAKHALAPGLDALPICRVQGGEGKGTVEIVWTPDGEVSRVAVSPPFGDSPAGACIARRFMGARVPPFVGSPQSVRVSFRI